jgi:plasmid stabilization system protein ParE
MSEKFRIQWAPIAIQDLDGLIDYIATRDSSDAAMRVYDRIMTRVDTLAAHPRRGRIVPELKDFGIMEYRESIAASYRVFYRIAGQAVSILGVLDGRRDLEEMLVNRALETDALQ